jgi:quinohemoprotein ethanol dehydrogenase
MFELWPGPQGAHSWLPQAFSRRTGLLYIPVIEMAALIGPPQPGAVGIGAGMGATLVPDAEVAGSRHSFLKAWDPVAQKLVWSTELPGVWPGGVLATAGGLVFQGRIDGQLIAYDARTGRVVWSFKAQAPIVAPPISYRVNGRQYITVLTGSGSQGGGLVGAGNAAWRTDYRLPRHVLTFALGGKDRLPAFTPPPLVPPEDPDFKMDPAMAQKGGIAFAAGSCLVCHGMNAIGAGAAPDLRFSALIMEKDAFRAIVKEGALKPAGMPSYPQISDEDVEAIRYYLRLRAKQAPADLAALKKGARPAGEPPSQASRTGS